MNLDITTKQTNSAFLGTIFHETLTAPSGETVVLLLQINSDEPEMYTLKEDLVGVIDQHIIKNPQNQTGFDECLKAANDILDSYTQRDTSLNIQAFLGHLDGDNTFSASHIGQAEAYIIRDNQANQITEYTRGASVNFVHIASGELQQHDIIICSTERLLRVTTPAQLSNMGNNAEEIITTITTLLEQENEAAAIGVFVVKDGISHEAIAPQTTTKSSSLPSMSKKTSGVATVASGMLSTIKDKATTIKLPKNIGAKMPNINTAWFSTLLSDLHHPDRKRRAHLLLIASIIGLFIALWFITFLYSSLVVSKGRGELQALVEEANNKITIAETRNLANDREGANAILEGAEQDAKAILENERGLYRSEALNLLESVDSMREQINNVFRVPANKIANLAAETPDIKAQGMIGIEDGEFTVFDRQDIYNVNFNVVGAGDRVSRDDLISSGIYFERFNTKVFHTADDSIIEIIEGIPTNMKTDDASGWKAGIDLATYNRFLYVLSPQANQIYKYERLNDRYGAPSEYNVNGALEDAVDMTIDGSVYTLHEDGKITKLLRGEVQELDLSGLPAGVLEGATKIVKIVDGNLYVLSPDRRAVIVITDNETGKAVYQRQYILEGDLLGDLVDIYVTPNESRVYLLDSKRIYVIDLR